MELDHYTPKDAISEKDADGDYITGIYVVGCKKKKLYRVGAAGVQTGKKGSLYQRLKLHEKQPPKTVTNQTEKERPFKIVFAIPLAGQEKYFIELAEKFLFRSFGIRFPLVIDNCPKMTGTSIFQVTDVSKFEQILNEVKNDIKLAAEAHNIKLKTRNHNGNHHRN